MTRLVERIVPKRGAAAGFRGAGSRVLRQGAGNATLNFAALVVNFAITLVLSHLLGATGYGAYAFALSLALILAVPAVLGLTPLLVRELTSYRLSESWGLVRGMIRRANESVVLASAIVCGIAAFGIVVSGWPRGELRAPSLVALPLVPLIALTSVRQGVMQGFARTVLGRAPETVIMPIALLMFAAFLGIVIGDRFDARWAVGAADSAGIAALVAGMLFLRRVLPAEVDSAPAEFRSRRWARAAVPLALLSAVSTAGTQLPTVILGAIGEPDEVGVFNVASRIASVLPFLLIAATPAIMPAIAELDILQRHGVLQRLMTRSARFVLIGSLPVAVIAIIFAGPLLNLFGTDFEEGKTALRILAVGQLVSVACGLPGTALIMFGDAAVMTVTLAATTTLTLVLTGVLVPQFGATGAALGSASGVIVANLVLSAILWRRRRIYAPALLVPRSTRA